MSGPGGQERLLVSLRDQARPGSAAATGRPSSGWPTPLPRPDETDWPPAPPWPAAAEIAHGPAGTPEPPAIIPPSRPNPAERLRAGTGHERRPWDPIPDPVDEQGKPSPFFSPAFTPADVSPGPITYQPALDNFPIPDLPIEPRFHKAPVALSGPDLTAPFAGRDVISQSNFGLAAAPVPADYGSRVEEKPTPTTLPLPKLPDDDEDD
jgi:hypothetical protein